MKRSGLRQQTGPPRQEPCSDKTQIARNTTKGGPDVGLVAFPDHYLAGMAYQRLGECLKALKQFEKAEPSLLKGHDVLSKILGPEHERTRLSHLIATM